MPGVMEEEHDVEYSSGCESGWTMYLNQSYCSRSFSLSDKKVGFGWEGSGEEEEEEEEDMSMLSDASSGPPLVLEDYGFCQRKSEFGSASSAAFAREGDYSSRSRRSPRKEKEECLQWMDDTASSHAYSFSKTNKEKLELENRSSSINREETVENVMEFSMDFSSTHSRSKSSRKKQNRFFQRALPGKASPLSPVEFAEKRTGTRYGDAAVSMSPAPFWLDGCPE